MSSSSRPLAERERADLADLLEALGPDAPTCCAGWDTAHLAAHLVVRDRRPDALPGYGLERLSPVLGSWAHRVEDRLRGSTGYTDVVARVRSGPAAYLPMGWPGVGTLLNTTEFVIHHEDVRRARPGWTPRRLSRADQDQLWRAVKFLARQAAGRGRTLVLRRADVPGAEKRIGSGEREKVLTGEPLELLLWLSGRKDVARVAVS
ncbi:TIGR03085 family metal-binding protein [Geodermatophilus sp. URMC 64]